MNDVPKALINSYLFRARLVNEIKIGSLFQSCCGYERIWPHEFMDDKFIYANLNNLSICNSEFSRLATDFRINYEHVVNYFVTKQFADEKCFCNHKDCPRSYHTKCVQNDEINCDCKWVICDKKQPSLKNFQRKRLEKGWLKRKYDQIWIEQCIRKVGPTEWAETKIDINNDHDYTGDI